MNKIASLILLFLCCTLIVYAEKRCYWNGGDEAKIVQLTYFNNVLDCDTWAKGVWKEISGYIWSPKLCWSRATKTCGLTFEQMFITYWEQKAGYYDCVYATSKQIYTNLVSDGGIKSYPFDYCWEPQF
ncbi:hypothetical protein HK098_001918 [Nowakowskiella sp. JEL0407]|nr:hypothetical protein HK098_001918 [Nowakowskiella sp. JEL0407]